MALQRQNIDIRVGRLEIIISKDWFRKSQDEFQDGIWYHKKMIQ